MTFGAMTQMMALRYQVQDKGGSWLIAYLDLDESRQFRVFNSLGFEFYQSGGNLKGAIYLHKVGREYKKPGTNEVWSYSDSDLDDDYYNSRGTFFHNTDFNRDEIAMQQAGFILNRIYFNYGTSTSGSTGTAKPSLHRMQIYNLKLGWGDGRHQITTAFAYLKSDHSIRRLSCNSVSHDPVPGTQGRLHR